MEVVSSYSVRINDITKATRKTIKIYREAVTFFIDVISAEISSCLAGISSVKSIVPAVEKLSHRTTKNFNPKYDFSKQFYKFPSYLRRSAIAEAFGIVSSFRSSYVNWEKNGSKGQAPRLQRYHNCNPVFYYSNMFEGSCYNNQAEIKIYNGKDWVWLPVTFCAQDVKYLHKKWKHVKPSAPTLEHRYGKNYLRFSFAEKVKLNNTSIQDQKICSVDLGLNNHAVCSVADSEGTVYAKKFINLAYEKDFLHHKLNRLKKFQREHGSQNAKSKWSFVNNINENISKQVAHQIVEFAALHEVGAVVFEYLNFKGKKSGSKAQKLALWRKREIQQIVEHQIHRLGMRFSRVNPYGTSKYAFDGSGEVNRNKDNYSLCIFQNGKRYNCDLNASYNIGARYFIRELLKPFSAMEMSLVEAKVPGLVRRTECTLSTLISLSKVLSLPLVV